MVNIVRRGRKVTDPVAYNQRLDEKNRVEMAKKLGILPPNLGKGRPAKNPTHDAFKQLWKDGIRNEQEFIEKLSLNVSLEEKTSSVTLD